VPWGTAGPCYIGWSSTWDRLSQESGSVAPIHVEYRIAWLSDMSHRRGLGDRNYYTRRFAQGCTFLYVFCRTQSNSDNRLKHGWGLHMTNNHHHLSLFQRMKKIYVLFPTGRHYSCVECSICDPGEAFQMVAWCCHS